MTFFNVPQREVPTSAGPCPLPILYHDVSVLQGFFPVNRDAAERKLEGTGLRPVTVGRKAMAGLALYEYRKTSVGAYNEVGLCLVTYREGEEQPNLLADFRRNSWERGLAMHVLDLPVTTEAANAAGREIWGFPKFVTDIPLTFGKDRFSGSVLDPRSGSPIMKLEGTLGRSVTVPGFDLVLYSHLDNRLVKTVVDVDARYRTYRGNRLRLTVGESNHRMAKNLRELGMDGMSPIIVQESVYFHSRLHGGGFMGLEANRV